MRSQQARRSLHAEEEMKVNKDANLKSNASPAIESVGDATMISYSVFASLEEMRQAEPQPQSSSQLQSAPESAAMPGAAAAAGAEAAGDSLQAELDRYSNWLRTFNR
jgi:hypothetical protein